MSGIAYEDFARKSFKIMLMMITQDKINFENKNFIEHNGNINLYQKQDNINTHILKNST